jgi:hypothetical protein
VNLLDYAAVLSRSPRPSDLAVAAYVRTHHAKLAQWVRDGSPGQSREDLQHVALMACYQAVLAGDVAAGLRAVRSEVRRAGYAGSAWNKRRRNLPDEGSAGDIMQADQRRRDAKVRVRPRDRLADPGPVWHVTDPVLLKEMEALYAPPSQGKARPAAQASTTSPPRRPAAAPMRQTLQAPPGAPLPTCPLGR